MDFERQGNISALDRANHVVRPFTEMGKLVVLRVFGTDDIVPGHVAEWLPEP
jgi:hypothetical protein